MAASGEKRKLTLEEGVLKLMQQPGVMDAVLKILEHASKSSKKPKTAQAKAPLSKASAAKLRREEAESAELAAALAESAAMAEAALIDQHCQESMRDVQNTCLSSD